MELNLKKDGHGGIEIIGYGLKFNVSPRRLVKLVMNKNSQKILDQMIEEKYKNAINDFSLWYYNNFSESSETDEKLEEKYKHSEHVEEIQNLADITRELIPLHSEGEIELYDELSALSELAYSFWRYNSFYGFKGTEEVKI